MKDYPEKVLESYDTIEKLIVSKKKQPIVTYNSVTAECLLDILNNLYEENTHIKGTNHA